MNSQLQASEIGEGEEAIEILHNRSSKPPGNKVKDTPKHS